MVYQSNHLMEDRSGGHDVSPCENRLSSERCVPPQVEQDRVFLPLGYEPGYDYPLLVWLPQSNDVAFDLGRTILRAAFKQLTRWLIDIVSTLVEFILLVSKQVEKMLFAWRAKTQNHLQVLFR